MIETGLVSVTFRKKFADEIIAICKKCGIRGIEWGSDIHAPAGDTATAASIRQKCLENGIAVYAYGSYYRAGENADPHKDFLPYLESAKALGAPIIRIWAGSNGTCTAADRERLIADAKAVCQMSHSAGIRITFEYHQNTLTDNATSALALVRDINEPNMRLYWQPENGRDAAHNENGLSHVLPYLENVHVFHWTMENGIVKHPLREGAALWRQYLAKIASDTKKHRFLLEFVKDGNADQLAEDAAVLRELLEEAYANTVSE